MSWLLIKTFLGKLITFISENYRVIAFVILAGVAYHYKASYDDEVIKLAKLKSDISTETLIRQAENAQLKKYAADALYAVTLQHTEQLESLKNDYEKRNKINVGTIANLRNELRDKIASDSIGMPEVTVSADATTEEWRNSYATLVGQHQTLKYGCAITTSDYNALRDYADNNCRLFGCE